MQPFRIRRRLLRPLRLPLQAHEAIQNTVFGDFRLKERVMRDEPCEPRTQRKLPRARGSDLLALLTARANHDYRHLMPPV
ncbi:MAG: hypothetical protein ACK55I_20090, partial [bacterium]